MKFLFFNSKCALVQKEEAMRKEQDRLEKERKKEEERRLKDRLREQEQIKKEQKKEADRLEKESRRVRMNSTELVYSAEWACGYWRRFLYCSI